MSNENYDILVQAYHDFDVHPLKGEFLEKFYSDEIYGDTLKNLTTAVQIGEKSQKILLIGHVGIGKSTLLNKMLQTLADTCHVVMLSVAHELNGADIDAKDILIAAYVKLVLSLHDVIPLETLLDGSVTSLFNNALNMSDTPAEGKTLLESVLLKLRLEPDSRQCLRKTFAACSELLRFHIAGVCDKIPKELGKDVLIVIDDADKLPRTSAEKIFFEQTGWLTLPEVRMVCAFPLALCYSPLFAHMSDQTTDRVVHEYMPLTPLQDMEGKYQKDALMCLMRMALRRIERKFVSTGALKYAADKSGGVFRDMIRFMQDACKIAIATEKSLIDEEIVKMAVRRQVSQYERLFDFPVYQDGVRQIIRTRQKHDIPNDQLIHLLEHLFVLSYGTEQTRIWYNAHPCLRECIARKK